MSGAVFPWRSANRFELLVDGPNFFPQMLVGIARAERQVELEQEKVRDVIRRQVVEQHVRLRSLATQVGLARKALEAAEQTAGL